MSTTPLDVNRSVGWEGWEGCKYSFQFSWLGMWSSVTTERVPPRGWCRSELGYDIILQRGRSNYLICFHPGAPRMKQAPRWGRQEQDLVMERLSYRFYIQPIGEEDAFSAIWWLNNDRCLTSLIAMETLGFAGWSEPHRGAFAPKLRAASLQQSCWLLLAAQNHSCEWAPPRFPDQSDEKQREPQRRPRPFEVWPFPPGWSRCSDCRQKREGNNYETVTKDGGDKRNMKSLLRALSCRHAAFSVQRSCINWCRESVE